MTNSLIYYYTDGACGTGKTYRALQKIVMGGGKHLFVVDRKETMIKRQATVTKFTIKTGHNMPTLCIMSGDDRNTKNLGVRRRIHDLPSDYIAQDDIVVFVTHEAMRMCDFSDFADWSIWIDEVPDIMDNETMSIAVSHVLFANLYALDPILDDHGDATGWSEVSCVDTTIDLAMIASDDIAQGLRVLHRRVIDAKNNNRRSVIVNGSSWSEFNADKKCNWFSIWSPEHLSTFQNVTFLANAFTDSLTFQIMRSMWPDIEWLEVKTNGGVQFGTRTVTIHYYADNHVSSRKLFSSESGKANLAMVCADINSRLADRDHIWMCNRSMDDTVSLTGRKLSPRQAGSNDYANVTAATCIYSVKPDADQRKVYDLLGVNSDYYTETNERETILQFMCRTSVRDPLNTAPVDLFVYDKSQAEYLLRYFERDARGYAIAALELHDLGFAQVERKAGRPTVVRSPEEKKELARVRQAQHRARARLKG